jgi:hypothetical protein
MARTTTLGFPTADLRLAAALDGDAEALFALLADDAAGELARRHRAGPALYRHARRQEATGPAFDAWHRDARTATARHLALEAALEDAGRALDEAGVAWAPLKGFDLASRFGDRGAKRPTGDLDLLIASRDLDGGRHALEAAGFRGLDETPHSDAYLREEGYAWQATHPSDVLLELHFRLWGLVPESFAAEILERATPDPALPPGGHRLRLADAYVVAAVHLWLDPPPRRLLAFYDLVRIADRLPDDGAEEVVAAAARGDLELPVMLAAEVSHALWRRDVCGAVARRLGTRLRAAERLCVHRLRRRGPAVAPLWALVVARRLARRRSRHGLTRTVARRLWPHPGTVERLTPGGWSRIRRRIGVASRSWLLLVLFVLFVLVVLRRLAPEMKGQLDVLLASTDDETHRIAPALVRHQASDDALADDGDVVHRQEDITDLKAADLGR